METQAIKLIPELLELLKKDGVSVPQAITQATTTTACDNKKQKSKSKKSKPKHKKQTHDIPAIDDNQTDYEQEEKLLLQSMMGEKPFANAVLKSFYRNKHGRILLAVIGYDTDRLLHLIEDAVEASENPADLIAYENAKTIAILIDRAIHKLPFYPADWQTLADKYGESGLESHLIPQDDYTAKRAVALIRLTNQTQQITDDIFSLPFDDNEPLSPAAPSAVDYVKATVYTALWGNLTRVIYLTMNHTFKKYEASSGTIWDKRLKKMRAKTPKECVWVTEQSITYGTDDGENATLLARIESPFKADDIFTLRRREYIERLQDETIEQVKRLLRNAKKAGLSAYKKKKEIDYIKGIYELKLNAVNYL